jgi:hypothetical protein
MGALQIGGQNCTPKHTVAQAWPPMPPFPAIAAASVLSRRFTRGCAKTALNSLAAMSPSNRRSRFLENVE